MEARKDRKQEVADKVLKRPGVQQIRNRIYRIAEKHFHWYHVFDQTENKQPQYAFSFYFGIHQCTLEHLKKFQGPHILIICDHKNSFLNGEDAFDLLLIPTGFFWDNLRGVPFKPSSIKKNPGWNMNIRVTKDRKYQLDIPGKDNIPLNDYLNNFRELGISDKNYLNEATLKGGLPTASKTNCLPTKGDCEIAIEALQKGGRERSVSKEQVFDWLELDFQKRGIGMKSNWKLITERNLDIWFRRG